MSIKSLSIFLCTLGCVLGNSSVLAGFEPGNTITTDTWSSNGGSSLVAGDFETHAIKAGPEGPVLVVAGLETESESGKAPSAGIIMLAGLQQTGNTGIRGRGDIDLLEEGQAFLARNARRGGVTTMPSGLQYEVLSTGAGKQPGPKDWVLVDYRGTLIDGFEFGSSKRDGGPVVFRVDQVIPGWTEALQMMREGDEWRLYIPTILAFPHSGPLEHRALIFDVNLLQVDVAPPGDS